MKCALSFISCRTGGTVTALTPNLVVITRLDCGITYVKAKEYRLRIQTHYQEDCQRGERKDLLRIFDYTEYQNTATDESDEQDSYIIPTVSVLTPNLVVITGLDCGSTYVIAKEFLLRIKSH